MAQKINILFRKCQYRLIHIKYDNRFEKEQLLAIYTLVGREHL